MVQDSSHGPGDIDALRRQLEELQAANRALQETEEQCRAALGSISDAILMTDSSGHFTFVSPNVADVFSQSPAEVRRLGTISRLLGDVPADPAELAASGGVREIECTLKDRAGQRRIVQVNIRSITAGKSRLLFTCRDITHTRRIQEQLRQLREDLEEMVEERSLELRTSNEQLEMRNRLLEALGNAQAEFISEENPRLLFDRLLEDLLSLTDSQFGFIGQVLRDASGQPHLKTHAITEIPLGGSSGGQATGPAALNFADLQPLVTAVMTSGQPLIVHDPETDPRLKAPGKPGPPLKSFLGLPLFSNGELVGMVGIANRPRSYDSQLIEFLQPFLATCGNMLQAYRQVQRRRQAEEELARSERNFRNSIAGSPLGTAITTSTDKLLYVNQALLDLYGYDTAEELMALPAERRYTPESYASLQERQRRVRQGAPAASSYEVSIVRRDGEVRHVLMSRESVLWDGQPRFLALYQDITERQRAETALRQSRQRFHDLANLLPQSIWETDAAGNFTFINRQGRRAFGLSDEDEPGNVFDTFADEDRERARADLQAILRGETSEGVGYTARRKDGSTFPVLVYAAPITTDGQVTGLRGVTVDITDLRRTEMLRRQSEDRYRLLFEKASDAIFILDRHTGRFVDCNTAAEHLTGLAAGELRQMAADATDSPDGLKQLSELLAAGEGSPPSEITFHRPDGTTRTALVATARLDGELVFGIARDITERIEAERTIRASRASLANAQRIAHLGNWDWDIPSDTLTLSDEACRILQLEPGEVTEPASLLSQRVHPEDRETVQKAVVQALFEGRPYNYEYRILKPDGSESVVHVRGEVEFDDDGKPVRASGTIQDITERRILEKQVTQYQELNELKTNLLSTVSHELRTPLAIIKGYSSLLLDYDERLEAEEKHEYLQSIDKATTRLVELVDHILDMSRLDSGMLRLEKTSASLARLIREAVAEARLRAPEHRLVSRVAPGLPRVRLDVKRIRQVLDNLLDNAIKYSDPGSEITASAEAREGEVLVSVADQGIGIPAAEVERVFDRMYRAEKRKSDSSGVGLGLAICRGLVEAHGGRIWIESQEGRGTTVFFTLPT